MKVSDPSVYRKVLVSDLSHLAVRLWSYLASRANDQKECWPGYDLITQEIHCNRTTLSEKIRELEAKGWLKVERRKRAEVSHYHLLEGPVSSTQVGTRPSTQVSTQSSTQVSTLSNSSGSNSNELKNGVAKRPSLKETLQIAEVEGFDSGLAEKWYLLNEKNGWKLKNPLTALRGFISKCDRVSQNKWNGINQP